MKNIKIYKPIALLMAAILIYGCEGFDELNIDPDQAVAVPADYLLTSAQKGLADDFGDEWASAHFSLLYSQYWAQNAYPTESRYQLRPGVNNTYWTLYYAGADGSTAKRGGIMDLQNSINLASQIETNEANNQVQVARIMKAWAFHNLVDIYGDVPYSQALSGADVATPVYDDQRDIYIDILNELKEASEAIVPGVSISGDLIYSGDVDQWVKFANSLRLRVAMRASDVADMQTLVQSSITEAIAGGLIASNADDALLPYQTSAPNNNPLNEDRKTREDYAVSSTLIDLMNAMSDPRIGMYADEVTNAPGTYTGMIYGLEDNVANNTPVQDVSQPSGASDISAGVGVYAATFPYIFMSYPEVEFLLAEAVQRGYTTGTAATHYNNAIQASMDFWGVDAASATSYIAANPYNAADFRTSIGVQKWLAMYMQGHQAWAEWRRLDFGVLTMPADGILVQGLNTIPTRRPYPTDEQTLNGANYSAAVANIGGSDDLSTRLFWDVSDNTVLPSPY
ncbi:MAG: SusD/RagB family nutrient-binding outer membrane lipoprotein [Reichenbachiella sp.]|uniref:SusD/RagB family nutrient-binding outer membrane lipoprotein n=1 Tax=Reichenbachiella sp. TaxID=2184521 RepID=UPI003299D70F